MASFGRLTISGLTGSNENTLALANINMDFSLLKIMAPKEFADVGNNLSPFRRREAEEGHIHQTARKLGAIFEPILPSTPELLRSYGTRVSEIAQKTAASIPKSQGMFTKQTGIDAASIWAAATSGSGALQVHLLACMLARIWDQKDSISIWEELLKSRQIEIQESFQNDGSMSVAACSSYLASLQTITRTHIGEWDDSARSWLRIADRSPTVLVRQNQLNQVIGKSRNTVSSRPSLYQSVMEAWTLALEGMERLLKGSPQRMQTGGLLLGLNAWHLYPDINLLGDQNMLLEFNDPLVPKGAILTVGVVVNAEIAEGLQWSLPLAHLRYYGDPITRTGRLRGVRNRISLPEFMQTILGCLLEAWKTKDAETDRVLNWIVRLEESISRIRYPTVIEKSFDVLDTTWLRLLAVAAQQYLESNTEDKALAKRLFRAGRLYGSKALLGTHATPFFGLSQTVNYFRALKHQESKIKFLRELLKDQKQFQAHLIIRYVSERTGKEEFATVIPGHQAYKRKSDGTPQAQSSHVRWVHEHPSKVPRTKIEVIGSTVVRNEALMDSAAPKSQSKAPDTEIEQSRHTCTIESSDDERIWTQARDSFDAQRKHFETLGEVVRSVESASFHTMERDAKMRFIWGKSEFSDPDSNSYPRDPLYEEVKHFSPCFGDFHDMALFLRVAEAEPEIPKLVPFETLEAVFVNHDQLADDFLPTFNNAIMSLGYACVGSLRAVATIHKIYESLPSATIAIKLLELEHSLAMAYCFSAPTPAAEFPTSEIHSIPDDVTESEYDFQSDGLFLPPLETMIEKMRAMEKRMHKIWISTLPTEFTESPKVTSGLLLPYALQLPEVFSCILLCESGVFDILPNQLMFTMAISSGDSMYIAAPLLTDPAKVKSKLHKVRHVMGNIGRAGTALLQAPTNPKIRAIGVEQWTYISAEDWDGNRRDSFTDTSLHLWFTGSNVPIDGNHAAFGEKDTELYMLESVVSVHGRGLEKGSGEWVADLDILKALQDTSLRIDSTNKVPSVVKGPKEHYASCDQHEDTAYNAEVFKLTTMENWIELLETPVGNSIFLAMGNWQARQAATAISIAKGRETCVLRDETCWSCISEHYELLRPDGAVTFIA